MTTTPESTKGVPRLVGNPTPTLRADYNALADWVLNNVNARVADTTARDAISNKYNGLIVQTADTNTVWLCTNPAGSGSWIVIREDTGWIAPTLTTTGTPWINFGAPFDNAGYRRIGGVVYLKGVVKSGTASTVFVLPAGFRPAMARVFIVPSVNLLATINVNNAGAVQVTNYMTGASNANVSFDGVSFPAEI